MYSPTSPLSKSVSISSVLPESKKTRPRPRLLNLAKLLPINRSYTPTTNPTTPFRPIHTPDRPEQLTPASAAPSEEECREFFLAFRSPKKFGFSEADCPRSPEEERFGGIDKSIWRPWPLADGARPPDPVRTEAVVTSPWRIASPPLTAASFRSQSPLLEEAQMIRAEMSSTARLVHVDMGSRPYEYSQQERQEEGTDEETRSVVDEVNEIIDGGEQPRKTSYVTTLQEAQQRASILASLRSASRVSGNTKDSARQDGQPSEQEKNQQQTSESEEGLEYVVPHARHHSETPSSPLSQTSHRSWESGRRSQSAGHIAHHLNAIDENTELPSKKRTLLDMTDSSGASWTRDVRSDECVRRESVWSRFRNWQTLERQQQERVEDDQDLYGDWAEYYFTSEYFETERSRPHTSSGDDDSVRSIRTASSDTQARPSSSSLRGSTAVSPKTTETGHTDGGAEYFQSGYPERVRSKKENREAFAYSPQRGLMRPPGLRFQHQTDREALMEQEAVLSSSWTRPLVDRPRRPEEYYKVTEDGIINRPPLSPGTFGGMI